MPAYRTRMVPRTDAQAARGRSSLRGGLGRDPNQGPGAVERAPGRGYNIWDAGKGAPATIDLGAYTQVPAIYVVEAELGVAADSQASDGAQLRPEMFLLKRITFASTGVGLAMANRVCTTTGGQAPLVETCPGEPLTAELIARSIKVGWSDEFTKFLGRQTAICAALFGDSNGFLDLTREVLFAGKQTLSVDFERIFTLPGVTAGQTELVQVIFHGTGLLPLGINESGSL